MGLCKQREVVMKNKEIQVRIPVNGHANLDSFPFRFGYSFPQETLLTIRDWERIRDETVHDPNHRKVVKGSFTLPSDGKEYKAKFVLLKDDNTVVTVIRTDEFLQAEHKLSECVRGFREEGHISVSDIVEMYKQGIKTMKEVTFFLGKTLSNDQIQAVEQAAQLKINKIEQTVKTLVDALAKNNKMKEEGFAERDAELAEKDEEIQRLSKAGNLVDSSKPGAPRIINNTFKVVDAGMGNKGKYNQPAVYLDVNDGQSTSRIWNNWSRGQAARLALAQALIGEDITYDTWGNYNDEWFYHLHQV